MYYYLPAILKKNYTEIVNEIEAKRTSIQNITTKPSTLISPIRF